MSESEWGRFPLTRRKVIVVGGLVAVGATVVGDDALLESVDPVAVDWKSVRVDRIRRSDDLLVANLVLANFTTSVAGRTRYITAKKDNGHIGVILPGQSVGETPVNYFGSNPQPWARTTAELALPTIVAFKVLEGVRIQYDLDHLLDMVGLTPQKGSDLLNGAILVKGTEIEAPYRMRIEPSPNTRFLCDTRPKALMTGSVETNEIWHARLANRNKDKAVDQRLPKSAIVRAALTTKLKTSLHPDARTAFAAQAGSFDVEKNGAGQVTQAPLDLPQLILTSLGATLEVHGAWAGQNFTSWDHRMTLGRDQYVKVVKQGYLAPYGHPVTVIAESFRIITHVENPGAEENVVVAPLIQKHTLVIRERVVDTDRKAQRTKNGVVQGSAFPFTKVRCEIASSPPLSNGDALLTNGQYHVVKVATSSSEVPLLVPFVGIDHNGREVPFSSPVMFVGEKSPTQSQGLAWNGHVALTGVGTIDLGNQTVAVAPEDDAHPGLTSVPVVSWEVRVKAASGAVPPWRPVLEHLDVNVPGMSTLSTSGAPIRHFYATAYKTDEANLGGVVLAAESAPDAEIEPASTGGLMAMPSYRGLSSKAGAVLAQTPEAVADLASGIADPLRILGDLTLIGPLTLKDLVDFGSAGITTAATADDVDELLPKLPSVRHDVRDGRLYVDMDLAMPMLDFVDFGALPIKMVSKDDPIRIKVHSEAGGEGPALVSVDARLVDLAIQFAGIIGMPIKELRAEWASGGAPVFSFSIGNVQFLGALSFLEPLSKFLSLGAAEGSTGTQASGKRRRDFTDHTGTLVLAPSLAPQGTDGVNAYIDDEGLHLDVGFSIPDVGVGVFTLSGLDFGVGVALPFGGGLQIHAYFASYESPFTVTYCGFGGGGFVDILIDEKGLEKVTASLNVAGSLGIDLVVASATMSISAGFVLTIYGDSAANPPEISAFFRISGSVSIPLLCTVSVVFELRLTVVVGTSTKPTKLTGYADFIIKVDTLVYDEEVAASISRTIKGGFPGLELGSGSDPFAIKDSSDWASISAAANEDRVLPGGLETPTFRTCHTDASWREYATSFRSRT